MATSALASVKIDGVYYELYKKGTPFAKVVKGDGYAGKIVIPNTVTYEGVEYKVTSFAADAFKWNDNIISLSVGDNVSAIEGGSFQYCKALSSVTLGAGMTSIGANAFDGCTSLLSIAIPSAVTDIADQVFSDCSSLQTVTLPNNIENYWKLVF